MVVIAAVVAIFYMVCTKTFEYGAAIFSEEGMDPKGKGHEVVVTIPQDATASELGKILVSNGLAKDSGIFRIQAMLYDLVITPGTYKLSTEYNVEQIIDTINKAAPDNKK